MKRLVYDIAFNDSTEPVEKYTNELQSDGSLKKKRVWSCPFYRRWLSMIKRCYSPAYHQEKPTYRDVTCCEEWLVFSNFKRWMEQQDWEDKELDKDILGDGKLYSPDTCVFVNKTTNTFLNTCAKSRGEWPIGVSYEPATKKFKANCSNPFSGKRELLGRFNTPEEAYESWRKRKHELAQVLADMESDGRVSAALRVKYSVPHSGICIDK